MPAKKLERFSVYLGEYENILHREYTFPYYSPLTRRECRLCGISGVIPPGL